MEYTGTRTLSQKQFWKVISVIFLFAIMSMTVLKAQDYGVGATLPDEMLNASMGICANGSGETSLQELLSSDDGTPRAVLLSFFATW